jgi:hypothetical protein
MDYTIHNTCAGIIEKYSSTPEDAAPIQYQLNRLSFATEGSSVTFYNSELRAFKATRFRMGFELRTKVEPLDSAKS